MSSAEANQHIGHHADNWRGYPPTQRQQVTLRNWGLWKDGLNRGQAWDMIATLKDRTAKMTPDEISQEIARAQRRALGRNW